MNWDETKKLARRLADRGLEPFLERAAWLAVHLKKDCLAPCPIHAPSDHVLVLQPLHWRSDRGMFERICRHGTGHPDPDDLAFKRKVMPQREYERQAFEVHGCCVPSCCHDFSEEVSKDEG